MSTKRFNFDLDEAEVAAFREASRRRGFRSMTEWIRQLARTDAGLPSAANDNRERVYREG